MTTEVKACHTCKHFKRFWMFALFGGDLYAECHSPRVKSIDPVSGKSEPGFADISRRYEHSCGRSGNFWEAK
jgi:hypothetical protein